MQVAPTGDTISNKNVPTQKITGLFWCQRCDGHYINRASFKRHLKDDTCKRMFLVITNGPRFMDTVPFDVWAYKGPLAFIMQPQKTVNHFSPPMEDITSGTALDGVNRCAAEDVNTMSGHFCSAGPSESFTARDNLDILEASDLSHTGCDKLEDNLDILEATDLFLPLNCAAEGPVLFDEEGNECKWQSLHYHEEVFHTGFHTGFETLEVRYRG